MNAAIVLSDARAGGREDMKLGPVPAPVRAAAVASVLVRLQPQLPLVELPCPLHVGDGDRRSDPCACKTHGFSRRRFSAAGRRFIRPSSFSLELYAVANALASCGAVRVWYLGQLVSVTAALKGHRVSSRSSPVRCVCRGRGA